MAEDRGTHPEGSMPELSDARRRLVRRLRNRRTREREGLVLVEGPRAVSTALDAGARFRFVLTSEEAGASPAHASLLEALRQAGIELLSLPTADFLPLATTETPQGMMAVVEEPRPGPDSLRRLLGALPPSHALCLLILDALQDPGNVGTLIRSAAALGAPAVLALDGTADPWGDKAVRASAGEVFRLPLFTGSWAEWQPELEALGVELWVAEASGEDVRVSYASPGARLALVVGNEGAGPRPELRIAAARQIALPMAQGVESLNAAMAGALLLWALGPGREAK
jgi:RNA methyltransferase, TrmH family